MARPILPAPRMSAFIVRLRCLWVFGGMVWLGYKGVLELGVDVGWLCIYRRRWLRGAADL